ncbi:unnamed protein product, partial [Ceratitis capitata]
MKLLNTATNRTSNPYIPKRRQRTKFDNPNELFTSASWSGRGGSQPVGGSSSSSEAESALTCQIVAGGTGSVAALHRSDNESEERVRVSVGRETKNCDFTSCGCKNNYAAV